MNATTSARFDPIRPMDIPPSPAPRSAPAILRKVRGTMTRAEVERPSILGTFAADRRGIDSVTYWAEGDTYGVLIVRNRWTKWQGTMSAAQFDALRAHIGADRFRSLDSLCATVPPFPATSAQ